MRPPQNKGGQLMVRTLDQDSTALRARVIAGRTLTRRDAFVGCQEMLSILQTALAEATDGRGRVMWLTCEPGIGKTRTIIGARVPAQLQ